MKVVIDNDYQRIPFVTQQFFVQQLVLLELLEIPFTTTPFLRLYFFRERIATTLAGLPARKSLGHRVFKSKWSAVGSDGPIGQAPKIVKAPNGRGMK